MSQAERRLKVIIVGGSVAGLTLALALHHNKIDYVVLEAGAEMAPHIGASIVVLPSGMRILDQLGVCDDVLAAVDPLTKGCTWTGAGKIVVDADAPALAGDRMGYPLAFLLRSELLRIMAAHLPDQSRVITSSRVTCIEHAEEGVVVQCQDGSKYAADIVVGADGIHSTVRTAMQQHMNTITPGLAQTDQSAISAEYTCIYGISENVFAEGLIPGESHRTYVKDLSTLSFVGTNGKIFWFMFAKLDKRYTGRDIPRFTSKDCAEHFRVFNNLYMTNTVQFKTVWDNMVFANMLSLEEMQLEHWTFGRFVVLGDAAHKMTPNLGAGGNSAIESSAALANCLAKIARPGLAEIQAALQQFQEIRRPRANAICNAANLLTRVEAFATLPHKLAALYVIPMLGDFLTDVTCAAMVGAEKLDCFPLPARSLQGTMPFNPEQGIGKEEPKWKRALWGLPLLALLYTARKTMGVTSRLTSIENLGEDLQRVGGILLDEGQVLPVIEKFVGIGTVDKLLRFYAAIFTPMISGIDAAAHAQGLLFLADLVPLQAIWTVESIRRGNFLTACHLLPTIMSVAYQLYGIGFVAPIYYFLHYVQSPMENYAAADNRMCEMDAVKTIIPTIALSYVVPTLAMFTWPGLANRQWINAVLWQPFPIYANILQRVLRRYVTNTTLTDRRTKPEADMPYLRAVYGLTAGAAFLTYCYVRIMSPISFLTIVSDGIRHPATSNGFIKDVTKFLRYDHLCAFGAGAIWTVLSFRDLKKGGKFMGSWSSILGVFTGTTILGGPGAAMATVWAWREQCLPPKRMPVVNASGQGDK